MAGSQSQTPVTSEELMLHAAFTAVGLTFEVLDVHDWEEIRKSCRTADAVGPILMPSEWIAGSVDLKRKIKIADAVIDFLIAVREVREEISHEEGS